MDTSSFLDRQTRLYLILLLISRYISASTSSNQPWNATTGSPGSSRDGYSNTTIATSTIPTAADNQTSADTDTTSIGTSRLNPHNSTPSTRTPTGGIPKYVCYSVIPGASALLVLVLLLVLCIRIRKRKKSETNYTKDEESVGNKTKDVMNSMDLGGEKLEQLSNGHAASDKNGIGQTKQSKSDKVSAIHEPEKALNEHNDDVNCIKDTNSNESEQGDPDDYDTVDEDIIRDNGNSVDEDQNNYDTVDPVICHLTARVGSNELNDDDEEEYYNRISFNAQPDSETSNGSGAFSRSNIKNSKMLASSGEHLTEPEHLGNSSSTEKCVSVADSNALRDTKQLQHEATNAQQKRSYDLCVSNNKDDGVYNHTAQNAINISKKEVNCDCGGHRSDTDMKENVYNHLNQHDSLGAEEGYRGSCEYSHLNYNDQHQTQANVAEHENYSHVSFDPRKGSFKVLGPGSDDEIYDVSGSIVRKVSVRPDDYSHVVKIGSSASKTPSGNYDTVNFQINESNKANNDYSLVVKLGQTTDIRSQNSGEGGEHSASLE